MFTLQAFVLGVITSYIGLETYIWYQAKHPAAVAEQKECPTPDLAIEMAGKIACINNAAHIIDKSGLVALWDESRSIIICTESMESIIEGYHLWKKDQ